MSVPKPVEGRLRFVVELEEFVVLFVANELVSMCSHDIVPGSGRVGAAIVENVLRFGLWQVLPSREFIHELSFADVSEVVALGDFVRVSSAEALGGLWRPRCVCKTGRH